VNFIFEITYSIRWAKWQMEPIRLLKN